MPSIPPNNTPDPERIIERVWSGRGKLLELGLGLDDNCLRIVLSPEAFDILRLRAKELVKWRGAIMPHFGSDDFVPQWTMFGILIDTDSSLMRNEIRLRSEVVI